jgi:ABC-type nitrate/sulfonate/bicarbonate transport system substrate-binding protein
VTFKLDRRGFLIASAAAVTLPGCTPGGPVDSSRIKVALSWIPSVDDAGLWFAQDRGYFAANGLTVSHVPGGPNAPNALVALAAGSVQIAFTDWLSVIAASAKGNDFVIIGASYPIIPAGLMSLPTKPIRKAADILDKRILVQDPNHHVIFDAILSIHNLPIRYVALQSGFSADPLFAGDGDGYLCFLTDQPLALEAAGKQPEKDFVVVGLRDLGFDIPENLLVVKREFLDESRPAVIAFLRALARGWEDNNRDPTIAAKILVKRFGAEYGLDLPLEARKNATQIPFTKSPENDRVLWISPAQMTTLYRVAAIAGRTGLEAEARLFDLGALDQAVGR